MKLISMTDFVLQENKGGQQINSITTQLHQELRRIKKYANFLKQPLKLEMFVPCDEDGNVLEEPIYNTEHSDDCYCESCQKETNNCINLQNDYRKAKERVLFKGIDLDTAKFHCNRNDRTIEYFTSFEV